MMNAAMLAATFAAMRSLFLSWHLPDESMRFAGHVDDIDEDGE
jgi:hypothetical protein